MTLATVVEYLWHINRCPRASVAIRFLLVIGLAWLVLFGLGALGV